ncbi:MAG: alpha/beta fold hydrolase [Solirubrobacterales bacterium]
MTQPLKSTDLEVIREGDGPPVLFIHGSIVGPELSWRRQRPLAEHWTLILPSRPGFGASPPLERGDFELEAPLFADLLGEGAHLVGHSYGAVIALLVAARRPEAVRSLTVSEPGALGLAASEEAEAMIAQGETLYAARDSLPPEAFLRMFRDGTGSSRTTPEELSEQMRRGAELAMRERPPWEAEIPLAKLAEASFPTLVISGGHSAVFEAVCDAVAGALGAERAVIAGKNHSIPRTGAAYNERLHRFLLAGTEPAAEPKRD